MVRRRPQRHPAALQHGQSGVLPGAGGPNGFYESGSPSTITFYGRPFSEAEILALAKAYQDAAGFHLKHPKLEA